MPALDPPPSQPPQPPSANGLPRLRHVVRTAVQTAPWRWAVVAVSTVLILTCLALLTQPVPATVTRTLAEARAVGVPVVVGSSPPPEGAGRASALDDLRSLHIASRALHLLQLRYVEPDKFKPRVMLEEALQSVAHLIPQMIVDVPQRDARDQPLQLRIRIHESQHLLNLVHATDLYAVGWHLLDALRFVADHLPTDVAAAKVEYTAINGVLSTLDPYSRALDPDQWRDMQTNTGGNFGGLGIVILPVDGVLTIQSVLPDSPAAKAGLRAGDQIQQIDGEDTLNMGVDAAVERLRGEVDTAAKLVVMRKDWPAPQTITVLRAVIHLQSVESKVLDNGVGYARVKNFQRGTAAELGEAIDNLLRAGAHPALVLDLRDNPGGLLDEAIRICDLFIASGPAVTTVTGGKQRDVRRVTGNGRFTQLPLAVLISGHSASASEVVAGALKYAGRAIVLGEQSFGKGSVQVPYEIEEGALKLTVAKYLVPGDISIHGKGIAPDVGIQFVSATREQVSLFGGPHYSRATRKARAALESQPPPRPKVLLKVLLPDGSDRDRPDAETPADVMDREPRARAAAILRHVGQVQAAGTLAGAQGDLAEMARADDAALVAHLKRQGIDWRPGPAALEPPSEPVDEPQLRIEIVDGAKGLQAQAGEILRTAVTLTNLGKVPLHRLHVQTRSDDPSFDGHEQLVGRLEPGQNRTVPLSIRVSVRHGTVQVPLTVQAAQDGRLLPREDTTTLTVAGKPLPDFAFRYRVDDSTDQDAGDGVLQPSERAKLSIEIRNVGEGLAQAPVVRLRSLSGQRLHLGEGRARLAPLEPGATASVTLPIRGVDLESPQGKSSLSGDWQPVSAELVIADESLGGDRVQAIELPWARKPVAQANPRDLKLLQTLRTTAADTWNHAPRVAVSDQPIRERVRPDATGCWLDLRGAVRFDRETPARRFVTASVGGDKQWFLSADALDEVAIVAPLRLDTGLNVVTIMGQAGPRRSAERTLLVHCPAGSVPQGAGVPGNAQAP